MSPSLHAEMRGRGPSLLLLHGFTGSSAEWRPFLPAWAERFRTIAVDLPGHGKSDAVPETSRYRVERLLADLEATLDGFDVEHTAVLGYSMGGRLGLAFALAHAARTTALVLEGASPGIGDASARAARRADDEALAERIENDGVPSFLDFWMKQALFSSQSCLPPEVLTELRRSRSTNHPSGLAGSLRGFGSGAQDPLWQRLAEIDVPTLLVVGEKDEKFRRLTGEMSARIRDCEVAVIPDAGHNTHLENPRGFASRVSKFLDRVTARAEAVPQS